MKLKKLPRCGIPLFFVLLCNSLFGQTENLAKSEIGFAYSLYEHLPQENLIISPYSIFNCLLMTYFGAREETSLQMEKILFLDLPKKNLPQYWKVLSEQLQGSGISLANGIWVGSKTFILTDYRHTLEKQFQAHAESINFDDPKEASKIINTWISKETDEKITNLIGFDDIDQNTRLVLTNTVYFNGEWLKPFDPKKTSKAPFYISSEKHEEVEMLEQTDQFFYSETEEFRSISLPIKDSSVVCLFILTKDPLLNVEPVLKTILDNQERTQVHLKMPKFSLQQKFDLNQILKQLGMINPFTTLANFSGIDGLRNLYISKVLHEAYFSLDEYGVLATASSNNVMGLTGAFNKKPPVELTFDRPFPFFLIDVNTRTILFMGRYTCNLCP